MKTLSMFVIALAVGMGAGVTLGNGPYWSAPASAAPAAAMVHGASNAAFRDGLYQAQLAVERGSQAHIATGRWRSDEDRASFAAAYQQEYAQALGSGKHWISKVS